ncbi:MAG: sulfatase-like hydrolase/transferase, partial [Cyclobacteriaceae bacterium]|nr:sulfatase-like hydrolase/transferase [Cyclobacteriaceae bacterium]
MRPFLLLISLAVCWEHGLSQNQKPNIIYIMSDDHDDDAISAYRLLRGGQSNIPIQTKALDKMAREGMLFKQAFVSNSICSPARATILTGKFSHLNGVKDNVTPFDTSQYTFIKQMRSSGYQTALIGKWHLHIRPSGFDYFSILPGQGRYYTPQFVSPKDTATFRDGYVAEEITRQTIEWLEKRDTSKPFMLMMHHKAPHRNWMPALKYAELFSKIKFTEPHTLYADSTNKGKAFRDQQMSILNDMDLCTDLKISPKFLEDIPNLKPPREQIRGYEYQMKLIPEVTRRRLQEIYAERGRILQSRRPSGRELLALKYQWYMQDYMACVASVDESVGQLLDYLDSKGLSENTIVFYTSDQGFYLGENGWFDKRFMYDVSMKTPLIVRWKGHIRGNVVSDAMVQNIDLAPTFLDVAHVPAPKDLQGMSLMPLLSGTIKKFSRPSLYYRYYEFPDPHH